MYACPSPDYKSSQASCIPRSVRRCIMMTNITLLGQSVAAAIVMPLFVRYLDRCLPEHHTSSTNWLVYDPAFFDQVAVDTIAIRHSHQIRIFSFNQSAYWSCLERKFPDVDPAVFFLVPAVRVFVIKEWFKKCWDRHRRPHPGLSIVIVEEPINRNQTAMLRRPVDLIVLTTVATGQMRLMQWKEGRLVDLADNCSYIQPVPVLPRKSSNKPGNAIATNYIMPGLCYQLRSVGHPDVVVGSGVAASRLVAETLGWQPWFYSNSQLQVIRVSRPVDKFLLPGALNWFSSGYRFGTYEYKGTGRLFATVNMVVMVPFRLRYPANPISVVMSNAPIILVWAVATLLFTSLRICFAALIGRQHQSIANTFFDTLARSLGASCDGDDRTGNPAAAMLILVLSAFAILASALCAGALYEQHFVGDPEQLLDTLDELFDSGIGVCYPDEYMASQFM